MGADEGERSVGTRAALTSGQVDAGHRGRWGGGRSEVRLVVHREGVWGRAMLVVASYPGV